MYSQKITVNSLRYDRSIRRTWQCEFSTRKGQLIILDGIFDKEMRHSELGTIRAGTYSREYYWLNRWYNIFAFWEPDGEFRNWYCNIVMPPKFNDGVLDYVDLDIDVLVFPDFTHRILDLDEFADNSEAFSLHPEVLAKAHESLAELLRLIDLRDFPFTEKKRGRLSLLDSQNVAANDNTAAGF